MRYQWETPFEWLKEASEKWTPGEHPRNGGHTGKRDSGEPWRDSNKSEIEPITDEATK